MPIKPEPCSPWRLVQEGGVDPILRGLFATPAKQYSPQEVMNEELTEKLFEVRDTHSGVYRTKNGIGCVSSRTLRGHR